MRGSSYVTQPWNWFEPWIFTHSIIAFLTQPLQTVGEANKWSFCLICIVFIRKIGLSFSLSKPECDNFGLVRMKLILCLTFGTQKFVKWYKMAKNDAYLDIVGAKFQFKFNCRLGIKEGFYQKLVIFGSQKPLRSWHLTVFSLFQWKHSEKWSNLTPAESFWENGVNLIRFEMPKFPNPKYPL